MSFDEAQTRKERCVKLSEQTYDPEEIRRRMQQLPQPDGSVVTRFADATGSIRSTVYKPFSGVAFVKKDVNMPQFITNWRYGTVEAFAIEYCYAGSLECQIGEDYLYVSAGDIILFRTDPQLRRMCYPSSHYEAAQIVVYLEESSPVLNTYLSTVDFTLEMLIEKYLPHQRYYSMLKQPELLRHVFERMLHAPEGIRMMYVGVKSLESLILLASGLTPCETDAARRISRRQAELVKQVYSYVMAHPEERYSIDELAERFSICATQLKKYFQIVYGTSIQRFLREQKMRLAAELLETTDKKVTEVAQMFGYSNASKFSDAFCRVMGVHPKQYRMEHRMRAEAE